MTSHGCGVPTLSAQFGRLGSVQPNVRQPTASSPSMAITATASSARRSLTTYYYFELLLLVPPPLLLLSPMLSMLWLYFAVVRCMLLLLLQPANDRLEASFSPSSSSSLSSSPLYRLVTHCCVMLYRRTNRRTDLGAATAALTAENWERRRRWRKLTKNNMAATFRLCFWVNRMRVYMCSFPTRDG